ncbi:MAG: caspase family protein [Bacteroidota bacterium]
MTPIAKIARSLFCSLFLLSMAFSVDAQCLQGDCENGEGVYRFSSGTRHEGFFKDGQPFGYGVRRYADGKVFKGQWDIYPKGEGTMTYRDGTEKTGIWEKLELVKDFDCKKGDCKNGTGTYTYYNGDVYEGEFADGKRHGKGKLTTKSGDVYEGDFKDNQYNGFGTLTSSKGETLSGVWSNNELIKSSDGKGSDEDIEITDSEAGEITVNNATSLALNPESIKIWAVIVGIADYAKMPKLRYTDDDAYQVYAHLKSPEGGALPDEQITVLIDERATKEKIETALRETFGKADPNDVIFLYFSGHGVKGAFLPVDYKGRNRVTVSHEEIKNIMEESPAKFKICIADACHSGSMAASRSLAGGASEAVELFYTSFKTVKPGTALLLSSKSDEISLESNGLFQGVFSHYLIRGLKGEADNNADRVVTVDELFQFVSTGVSDFTINYQSPVIMGEFDKNMPVGVVRR